MYVFNGYMTKRSIYESSKILSGHYFTHVRKHTISQKKISKVGNESNFYGSLKVFAKRFNFNCTKILHSCKQNFSKSSTKRPVCRYLTLALIDEFLKKGSGHQFHSNSNVFVMYRKKMFFNNK